MFIKETTFTRKSGRKVTYLQLVQSIWDKEKKTPRHKVLCSLGRADKIDQTQLKGLIEKLSTYVSEPDIDEAGKIAVGQTYEFGAAYLVEQVFKSLSLDRFSTEANSRCSWALLPCPRIRANAMANTKPLIAPIKWPRTR